MKTRKILSTLFSSFLGTLLVVVTVSAATTISTSIQTDGTLSVAGLSSLLGSASTTRVSIFDRLYVGSSATTTIRGDTSTSTFSGGIESAAFNTTGSATSTASNGINLTSGCFSISGSCVAGGASLSSANTWTALQQFSAGASTTVFSASGNFMMNGNATTTASNGNIATQGSVTIGAGTAIAKHISVTATNVVSASIATITCGDYATITVSGAAVGDTVIASPTAVAGGIETVNLGWVAGVVSAPDTVLIRACNPTVGAIDTANTQTWRVDVWKH